MASNFWYWPGAGKKDQVTGFGLRDVDLPVHISKIDRRPGHPDAEMVKNIGNKARAVKTKVRVGRACLIGGPLEGTGKSYHFGRGSFPGLDSNGLVFSPGRKRRQNMNVARRNRF